MRTIIGRLTKMKFILLFFVLLMACSATKPPVWLNDSLKPEYPREAQKEGLAGKVMLYLFISETGEVQKVNLDESSGFKILDEAAVAYGKKLKFTPATKNGIPQPVVLTWTVTYEAITAFFQPKGYAAKINDLYRQAQKLSGEDREKILESILQEHDNYVTYSNDFPLENYNEYIKLFLLPEVADTWKVFFENWPLRFVVYHDFVKRFPDTDKTNFAQNKLVELLKADIQRIKFMAKSFSKIEANQEIYLKTIYSFFNKNYPEVLTGELKSEAEKYLNL